MTVFAPSSPTDAGALHARLHEYKQTPWPESASEPYRSSDLRLSPKLVPTFADRGAPRNQLGGSLTAVIAVSRPEPLLFLHLYSSG
jgi:hypothetical protein